jgi:hypothetical protein
VWEGGGERLVGLAWDGGRLLSGEPRGHRIVALYPDGTLESIVSEGTLRPAAVASDPAGRITVLDVSGRDLRFYGPDGRPAGSWSLDPAARSRAVAVAVGEDGTIHLFDEASEAWLRSP